jgi:hypothetical protein
VSKEDVENQFINALTNWLQAVKMRPDCGYYAGAYQDYREETKIAADGGRRVTLTPIPHEAQALDYKCWRVYVYAREAFLASR